MAFTTPVSYGSGVVGTAAFMNTYVRDNIQYLFDTSANRPRVEVTHNTTQSIATASATALTFNTENVDAFGVHSTATNPTRLTIPTGWDGWWLVTGWCEFAANATGQRQAFLSVNGVAFYSVVRYDAAAAGTTYLSCAALIRLVASNYVELFVLQSSGGALAISASPILSAAWLSNAG